ncbi:hypothetical protein ACOSQ3_029108 [Xanthoceras sorbifolium]
MSSPSNLRRHKAGTGGPSNKEDRKSRPFDNILLDYEKFAAVAHQREVTESSILGRTEVWGDQRESAKVSSSRNRGESKGPGVEERNDSSLVVSGRGGGLETETGSSSFPSSVITRKTLVELVHTFHLPQGHKVLIHRVTNSPTHSPQSYVGISSHHLSAGVLNLLELVPVQLTPNAYARLLSFFLIFRRKRIGSSTDNIIRQCFQMKKCPKKSLGMVQPDGIYYLPARSGNYRALL